jgi:hypothetical protein
MHSAGIAFLVPQTDFVGQPLAVRQRLPPVSPMTAPLRIERVWNEALSKAKVMDEKKK